MVEQSFEALSSHPDYQVLKRVPMELKENPASPSSKVFLTTIIDLETMGMDATQHEIIEIGMLSFSFRGLESNWPKMYVKKKHDNNLNGYIF